MSRLNFATGYTRAQTIKEVQKRLRRLDERCKPLPVCTHPSQAMAPVMARYRSYLGEKYVPKNAGFSTSPLVDPKTQEIVGWKVWLPTPITLSPMEAEVHGRLEKLETELAEAAHTRLRFLHADMIAFHDRVLGIFPPPGTPVLEHRQFISPHFRFLFSLYEHDQLYSFLEHLKHLLYGRGLYLHMRQLHTRALEFYCEAGIEIKKVWDVMPYRVRSAE